MQKSNETHQKVAPSSNLEQLVVEYEKSLSANKKMNGKKGQGKAGSQSLGGKGAAVDEGHEAPTLSGGDEDRIDITGEDDELTPLDEMPLEESKKEAPKLLKKRARKEAAATEEVDAVQ